MIENGYESNIWLHDITLDISEDFLTWLKNYNPNVRGRLKSSTIYGYFKHYKYIIARAVRDVQPIKNKESLSYYLIKSIRQEKTIYNLMTND